MGFDREPAKPAVQLGADHLHGGAAETVVEGRCNAGRIQNTIPATQIRSIASGNLFQQRTQHPPLPIVDIHVQGSQMAFVHAAIG